MKKLVGYTEFFQKTLAFPILLWYPCMVIDVYMEVYVLWHGMKF